MLQKNSKLTFWIRKKNHVFDDVRSIGERAYAQTALDGNAAELASSGEGAAVAVAMAATAMASVSGAKASSGAAARA